jgi:hypothetical protein
MQMISHAHGGVAVDNVERLTEIGHRQFDKEHGLFSRDNNALSGDDSFL